MKQSSKLAAILGAISIAAAAPAAADAIVGGINFGSQGESPSNTHLETATLAQQAVSGNGQTSIAYGYITTINGASALGSTNPITGAVQHGYCAEEPCALYYVATFKNSQNYSAAYVEFETSTVELYLAQGVSELNLLDQNSNVNLSYIQGLNGSTPWVTLTGHDNLGTIPNSAITVDPTAVAAAYGSFSGDSVNFTGYGLLDVDMDAAGNTDVKNFLNANKILDAIGNPADLSFTSSGNNNVLNEHDIANHLADSCSTGSLANGDWCFQGTANIRGSTVANDVPEPATLALLATGLGILGFARREQKKA